MSNSFDSILNQTGQPHLINQETLSEENTGYIIDDIINNSESNFTPAKITLNPKIFNKLVINDEITIDNIVIAKNKVIDTLTKTNKNLTNIIVNFNKDTVNTNNYITDLAEKINDHNKFTELNTLFKNEQFEHKNLKVAYNYLTKEYITLKKTYNGLNRIYIDNIINYFNIDDKKTITLLQNKNTDLKNENTDFKKKFLCSICFTNTINIILNPCGHITICKDCIEGMIQHSSDSSIKCPLCNNNIEIYNNIFLPI